MTDKQIMWSNLQMIADAESLEELKGGEYGLSYQEALEMAYDNLITQAAVCLENVGKPGADD